MDNLQQQDTWVAQQARALAQYNPTRLTIKEVTKIRLEKAKQEQADCEEILALLEKNQDVERLITLLGHHL